MSWQDNYSVPVAFTMKPMSDQIVACHLYSVKIQYQYVYHQHYCLKDCHHYSSCYHCCYFCGDCFCYAVILALVRRKEQSSTEKTQSHLKTQFPPEMTLMKSRQNFQAHLKIKFPVHSHFKYILKKVFKMTGVKLTIGRLSLIGIY